jgi:Kdo2-lipid IVA lauroyltransferase/acyltransferase
MKVLSKLSSNIQYYGACAMIRIIRIMPYHLALTLGRSIMLLIWAFMPLRRRIVRIQMGSALGLRNPWRLVLKVFMNQGDILIDTIKYSYMSTEEIRAKIIVEGKEHLDETLASKRGLLLFTGHIGNWEALSHFSRLLGVEFCIMADVRNDPRLDSLINDIRSRSGATILPPKGKALMLIKELRKGRTIGMVIDQRGKRRDGLFCTVFGLPAITNPAPAFIAIKGNALVQPVYIVKEHGRYRICIMKAVDAADFGEGPDAIQALSDFMQSFVASVVEKYPDQWFWLHSRWVRRANFQKTIRTIEDFREFVLSNAGKKVP